MNGHVARPDDIAVRAQDCIRVAGLGSATVLDTVRIWDATWPLYSYRVERTLTDASASGSGEGALFVDVRPVDVERTGDDDLVGRVQTGTATIQWTKRQPR